MSEFKLKMLQYVNEAKDLHSAERSHSLRSLYLVGALDTMRAACMLGMNTEQFAKHIGLSRDRYLKRVQVARVIHFHPRAKDLLEAGDTEISHLAVIAAKITPANRDLLLDGMKGKSKREVQMLASRVTADGHLLDQEELMDLKVTMTKAQMEQIDRAREVLAAAGKVPSLAQIISKAIEDLLAKRDPLKKAARSAARKAAAASAPAHGPGPSPAAANDMAREATNLPPTDLADAAPAHGREFHARRFIPADVRHQIWLRDGGQCTHRFKDGSRCPEKMMLEIDHKTMFCRGGEASIVNLELKCRVHNHHLAEVALGRTNLQNAS
ncbi:MAG: hypothetical protein NTZ90_07895 [Proteobacteria bacterium]|nr:hypothetical protein [Pseudomonadota bacterium]